MCRGSTCRGCRCRPGYGSSTGRSPRAPRPGRRSVGALPVPRRAGGSVTRPTPRNGRRMPAASPPPPSGPRLARTVAGPSRSFPVPLSSAGTSRVGVAGSSRRGAGISRRMAAPVARVIGVPVSAGKDGTAPCWTMTPSPFAWAVSVTVSVVWLRMSVRARPCFAGQCHLVAGAADSERAVAAALRRQQWRPGPGWTPVV